MKICSRCKNNKESIHFKKRYSGKDILNSMCIQCQAEYSKNWKTINQEYRKRQVNQKLDIYDLAALKFIEIGEKSKKEYHRLYFQMHKKRVNEYQKERKKTDPLYRIKTITRSRLSDILKKQGWKKNSKFTDYIGCKKEELIKYIELKFEPGMNWENYGREGWHLDHKIPLASANNEKELYALCHYTNLQPLWAEDNLKKHDKMPNSKKAA